MDTTQLLLERIDKMSRPELIEEFYKDKLTGVWNRDTWETIDNHQPVALCDLDSLKWINDNHGYREGDLALYELARLLQGLFPGRVFRLGGDEFVITGESDFELLAKLMKAQAETGGFSYGVGRDLQEADNEMKDDKMKRERSGKRSPRGTAPPYRHVSGLSFPAWC